MIIPEMMTTWSFAAGYTKFITAFELPCFIALQLWRLLLLLTFVSTQEATLSFGPQKARKMFFGR